MEVETTKQNLKINKLVTTKQKTVIVDGDIIVPDVKPDILNTIDSTGNICIYKKEVLDGKVRFDGGINLYLIYLADSEGDSTRGLNTTLDFTQIIDVEECRTDMELLNTIKINNIECKVLNGRKINIKVELDIDMQLYLNDNIEILQEVNNISNVQTLKNEEEVNTLIGKGFTKAYAKDTISYDNTENLAEILKANVSIINKEVKTSYNKVLIKADANTKIMYLTEDGNVKLINTDIPIIGFVDINDVSDDNMIENNFEIKNLIIKPNGNEQHSIYIEVEVGISCRVYTPIKVELIQDMYSIEEDINFNTKCIETEKNKKVKRDICNIEEKISISDIGNNQIYDVEIIPSINNINVLNKRIIYEGNLNLNFIFASNITTGIDMRNYTIPFSFEMEDDCIDSNKRVNTQIECIGNNFIVLSDGMIDCKVNIQFETSMCDTTKINIINEIKIVENREKTNYSMVIYVVKKGDSLWNIAKKYKTTILNIMELNNLDHEEIDVGNKLYISPNLKNIMRITA